MVKEPNDFVTISFSYIDQFGNETTLTQHLENDYCGQSELEVVNDSYRNFLNACGFYTDGKIVELVDDN